MSKKLKFDVDAMDVAVNNFQSLCEEFTTSYSDLDTAINELRGSDWLSAASTAYFAQYDETWKDNMEKHIKILEHLRDCLIVARDEYRGIEDQLPQLGTNL